VAIPSFNGVAAFGVAYEMLVLGYPARVQYETFPGVHGRLSIAHGGSGGFAEATFLQVASDPLTLSLYEAIWLNWQRSAQPATLIDTLDRAWARTRLLEFVPIEPIRADGNGVSRMYRARFEIPDMS
jgi:hypothetical protein